ncbi:MAG TPA: carboxypeptidase regulatory-like domain-containing protein [Terriglobales bacterium]|nr:carboxypeptidase regulatory-like domain-containing protein [Terriglobales bacterium]
MKFRSTGKSRSRLPGAFTVSVVLLLASVFAVTAVRADLTRTANVSGKVKFEGPRPKLARINMAADPACAKAHPGGASSDEVMTTGDGGLENVFVFVSEGLADSPFTAPAAPAVIEQKGCMYEPHVVAMQTNQKLRVVNDDHTLHNIHPLPANNREWNKAEPPGSAIEEAFAREEVAIPVKCNVHPWMHSYIAVFRHPFFTVSGKDGGFELKNLPPGTYTIKAWHEKLGTSVQKVTITPGETKSLEFVFKAHAGS